MDKKVKLMNPRGRIIEVLPSSVDSLLARGFRHPPEQTGEYNPIFDNQGTPIVNVGELKEGDRVFREKLDVTII